MLRFFEWLGGVPASAELEFRQRGRNIALMVVSGSGSAGLLALLYWWLGSTSDALMNVMAIVGSLLALLVWRLTHSISWQLNFVMSFFLVMLVGGAVLTSGLAYLTWLSVLPVVAFFAGGLRRGVTWSVVTVIAVVATCAAIYLSPFDWGSHGTPLVRMARVVTLPPTMAVLGFFFEVARAKSASELENARVEALLASEAKGRLLAQVSHEIRTPLHAVLGLTQAVLFDPLPTKARHDLELIMQSGNGLLALINDLLDIARAEAGRLEVQLGAVDFGRLVRDVAALHRSAAAAKHLEVVAETPAEPLWVRTDEVRVRQVLNNLLSNAVKFSDQGTVRVRLAATPLEKGEAHALEVRVEDHGPGMGPGALAKLFEPFAQFHPDRAREGTGLGLAISKELAERLGGTLSVESTEGVGTTFVWKLVVARSAAQVAHTSLAPLAPFRALVVDDTALNRRVAKALLEKMGASVTEAASGEEALARTETERFDVVLMDLLMPGMDGIETTLALRAKGVETPIVGLTASAGPETGAACLAAGMSWCLSKPVQAEVLRAELARILTSPAPEAPSVASTS